MTDIFLEENISHLFYKIEFVDISINPPQSLKLVIVSILNFHDNLMKHECCIKRGWQLCLNLMLTFNKQVF